MRKQKKEKFQRQENKWNRCDNSVKAFASMLICPTMRLLARTQTLLFIFIRVIICCMFIWKRSNGHSHTFSEIARIKGSTLSRPGWIRLWDFWRPYFHHTAYHFIWRCQMTENFSRIRKYLVWKKAPKCLESIPPRWNITCFLFYNKEKTLQNYCTWS